MTATFFDERRPFGPLPFEPASLDRKRLRPLVVAALWEATSTAIRERQPDAARFVEKVAVPVRDLTAAGIDVRVVDVVRDPRDVLASIRAFTARTGHDGFGRRPGEPEADDLPRYVADLPAVARRLGERLGFAVDPSAVGEAGDHATSRTPAANRRALWWPYGTPTRTIHRGARRSGSARSRPTRGAGAEDRLAVTPPG